MQRQCAVVFHQHGAVRRRFGGKSGMGAAVITVGLGNSGKAIGSGGEAADAGVSFFTRQTAGDERSVNL